MRRRNILSLLIVVAGIAILASGCAYFNTFYNAKKKFSEAERDNRNRPTTTQTQSPTQPQQPSAPQGAGVQRDVRSPEKYRKVIETCSKLLEFYPKSRWVDDALYLMGVSYYRLGELDRAERKFTELETIFPKSKHIPSAILFHARVLGEQHKRDEAADLLTNGLAKAKSSHDQAAMRFQLGTLYRDMKRWNDAAEQFDASFQLRPARQLALDASYQYGLCRYSQGQYENARDAFSRVAQSARDWEQAYQASVYLARAEMRLQNFEEAETILRRLSVNLKFSVHADEIPLELADLTLESDRTEEAIALYQDYVYRYPTGTLRGIAFYRLALIHRDRLSSLPDAKAYLDSTLSSSPPADIADSARAALNQISKGLLAMHQVTDLRAELTRLEAGELSTPSDTLVPLTPASPPLRETQENETDSARVDSTIVSEHTGVILETPVEQQVAIAVDSLHQTPQSNDSANADLIVEEEEPAESTPMSLPDETNQATDGSVEVDTTALRRELQLAYLHVAEFYRYSLVDIDSALHYYRLAANSTDNARVYWKANLQLAEYLTGVDGLLSGEAKRRFQEVVDADSVPLEAANVARSALDLPLIDIPIPPQIAMLHSAEEAYDRGAPLDSVLVLYDAVISFDSTSRVGQKALFAKAHIYEEDLLRMDSARYIYENLLAMFPDSSFADRLRRKLAPLDSQSVFLLSDAQLMGAREAVENLLEEEPDQSGWPPPEESLQGRRFH